MTGLTLRTKLALMFISVSVATFGVGGYLVSSSAKDVLSEEIDQRLEFQARAYATALDGHLRLLRRRIEDFASDGFIRGHSAELLAERGDPTRLHSELHEHLVRNKLPLEPAFVDISLVGPDGELLLGTAAPGREAACPPPGVIAGSDGSTGLIDSDFGGGTPLMAIATPLYSLDRERRLGSLVAWIHPGVWIVDALRSSGVDAGSLATDASLHLVDGGGRRLEIHGDLTRADGPSAGSELVRSGFGLSLSDSRSEEASPESDRFTHDFPISSNDWSVGVELPGDAARDAVSGLQSRFLGLGILLSLSACVLFLLPLGFVTRPLSKLQAAARRLAGGELASRVEVESDDEFGELGETFNSMAGAIEQRTQRLLTAAEELRARQVELAFERDRLRAVISSMHDGLAVLDGEGRVVVSNGAAGPLLEALSTDAIQLRSHHTCNTIKDSADACRACLFSPELGSRSCVLELAGGVFEIHATQLAPNSQGQGGRVLLCRDISDRVAQDERMIHQERLAVLGEVAAVMAHELNNPLAAISLYNQLLGSELEDPGQLENVQVIQRNIESCKQTIRELLDYSTNTTPELGSVDVNAALEDGSDFLRPLRKRSSVRIELELGEEPMVAKIDEIQLRQVFVNLLVNAIQAAGPDGGEVRVRTSLDGGHAVIDVHDTGGGIPEEIRQEIFRPFFTTKDRGEGTGLGLPTARRITEMHGGSLRLVSSSPRGSHFQVRLLLERAPVA